MASRRPFDLSTHPFYPLGMKLLRRLLLASVLGYWAFICYLTHAPRLPNIGPSVSDKTAHFLSYGLLSGLLYLTLWLIRPASRWLPLIVLAIVLSYGAVDEWTQPFFMRDCDLLDWLADAAGATLAVTVLGTAHWRLRCPRLKLQPLPQPAPQPTGTAV